MEVMIAITGRQSADGETDTVELTTAGTLQHTAEGYRLTYDESAATGMDGVVTSLLVQEDAVFLERTGALHSLLVLEKGRRHLCSYDTIYGSMMMGVYTSQVRNGLADDGGELELQYTLDINSGAATSHDIRIQVRGARPPEAAPPCAD